MSFITDNVANRDPVIVTLGVTQPSLYDTITLDGEAIVFNTGDVVVLFVRPLLSRTPFINGVSAVKITPPDDNGFNIRYDWQANDVAIEGRFMGWWGYQLVGSQLAETPEFPIVITDHGPGFGASTGVVVDGVSQWMPTTMRVLREDADFGDRFLQQHADYVKRIVMGSVVSPDLEAQYDPALVEYLSKRTAVRLITPAIDYWSRQYRSVQSQGPSEVGTYPDMIQSLNELHQRLCHELPGDWRQLQMFIPNLPQLRVEPAPMTSFGDPEPWNRHRTSNPAHERRASLGGPRWNLFMP